MRYSWRVYLGLAVVAILSFGAAWFLPTTDILRGVAGSPVIAALIAAVYQILRDQAHHERALALQRDQQHFVLGVTSHMANVAFDRHAEFCEKYIKQMQEGLSDLFAKGASSECLRLANQLAEIRLSFRAWMTTDVQNRILPFEAALKKLGAMSIALEGIEVGERRNRAIDEIFGQFERIVGVPREGNVVDEQLAPGRIMDHLQDILGVKQLVRLRIALVNEAVKTLEEKD